MHKKRLIVALVLLPVIIAYILLLPPVYFLALIIVVSLISQAEFYSLCKIEKRYQLIGLIAGFIVLFQVYREGAASDDLIAVIFLVLAFARLFTKNSTKQSLKDVSYMIAGVLYIPLLLGFQIKLREFGPEWIVYMNSCVWAADSLAYYLGKSFGKRKLYERISPQKTIIGAYGSFIGAVLVSIVFNYVLINAFTVVQAILVGLVLGFVSIIGDLVESMFKRDSGIKDSSGIIPGHGGMLDKIDGMVFTSPVVYWIAVRLVVL